MAPPKPPPIRACLFDMDGLLLDSEDKYTDCTNAILHSFGKPDLPWHIKAQLQGRPGPEAGRIFEAWAQLPISRDEVVARIAEMQKDIFPTCKPLPGAEKLLRTLRGLGPRGDGGKGKGTGEGPVYMALATSSHTRNFKLKTAHLTDLFAVFEPENMVLGDDGRIPPGRGKPWPDIYLLALETVNEGIRKRREAEGSKEEEVRPEECLVFEDSVPGVEAGRRAGMQVLWVPHPGLLNEYRAKEREVLAGKSGMSHGEMLEQMVPCRGEIDDGWAKRLESLEQFDYEGYGIKM